MKEVDRVKEGACEGEKKSRMEVEPIDQPAFLMVLIGCWGKAHQMKVNVPTSP